MAGYLGDTTTIFYNGVQLNSGPVKSSITAEPVYDDARRMKKWIQWTVTVEGWAYTGGTTFTGSLTDLMNTWRKALNENGKEFRYVGKGLELKVNAPGGTVIDVDYGPRVKLQAMTKLVGP